jgi:hypothetical protein
MERNPIALCASAILALAACVSTPPPPEPQKVAVDAVQREIKVGLDQASVLEALGPANRVSSDSQRREVWTYENISSDRVDTENSVGGGIIVFGGGKSPSLSSASQRTLTLVIYYDEAKKVRDFAYNYSSP